MPTVPLFSYEYGKFEIITSLPSFFIYLSIVGNPTILESFGLGTIEILNDNVSGIWTPFIPLLVLEEIYTAIPIGKVALPDSFPFTIPLYNLTL